MQMYEYKAMKFHSRMPTSVEKARTYAVTTKMMEPTSKPSL